MVDENKITSIDHPYPITHVQWAPASDLLATTGDLFRLYEVITTDQGDHTDLICRATMTNLRRKGEVIGS